MKYTITLLILLAFLNANAQDEKTQGLFYKISVASTLALNENFTIGNDDGETLINPSALFINNTLGFRLNEKSSIGLNLEYNWHSRQGLHFLPVYLSFRQVIFEYEDNLFIRGGYGRLLNISTDFEKGTFYKVGFGFQIFDEDYRNSFLIGLDFNRKRFGFQQLEKISSVSVFVEFGVF